jgi:hypothetical protein
VTGIVAARCTYKTVSWIDHTCAGTVTFGGGSTRKGFTMNAWHLDACKTCGHKSGPNRNNDATPVCINE